MDYNIFNECNSALEYLCDKYTCPEKGHLDGKMLIMSNGKKVNLLPWRSDRRFIELKNIVNQKTLEHVSTLRFCSLKPKADATLDDLLFQELDLCEWLGSAEINMLFAVFNKEKAVNIIVKLENGVSCSVECSVMLPVGTEPIDRHEIVARRGVASDRAVDTQVPQSSIYTFSGNSSHRFTDIDAEIFGLTPGDTHLVRGAFSVLSNRVSANKLNYQHKHLRELIAGARESEKNRKPCHVKEAE